jgi:hypothetical protein
VVEGADVSAQPTEFPGYKRNSLGHLVPIETISQWSLDEDSLVDELFAAAEELQERMKQFKLRTMTDIQAFTELLKEKYKVSKGGEQGFLTLSSYDAQRKIQISIGKQLTFGIELAAARDLVHECIRKWSQGGNANIRALVEHAFQTDEQGKLSPSRIWELTRIEIVGEPEWEQAMRAIRDAVRYEGEKPYLRFYRRAPGDKKWVMLPMDLAAL